MAKKSGHWRPIDEQDRQWRKQVQADWGGVCAFEGPMGYCLGYRRFVFHCHHIYTKGSTPALRHCRTNGIYVCERHHLVIHHNPKEWLPLIFEKLGTEKAAALQALVRVR